jgi:hypothetical protein
MFEGVSSKFVLTSRAYTESLGKRFVHICYMKIFKQYCGKSFVFVGSLVN